MSDEREFEAADDAGLHAPSRPGMGRAWWGHVRIDPREQGRALAHVVGWAVAGAVVGVIAGLTSAGFLESLSWATRNCQNIRPPMLALTRTLVPTAPRFEVVPMSFSLSQ